MPATLIIFNMVRRPMRNPRIIYKPMDRTDGGGFVYSIGKRGELTTEFEFHNPEEMNAILQNINKRNMPGKITPRKAAVLPKIETIILKPENRIEHFSMHNSVQDIINIAQRKSFIDHIVPQFNFNANPTITMPALLTNANKLEPFSKICRTPSEPLERDNSYENSKSRDIMFLLN